MISIIHPSRGRPEMAYRTFMHWIDKSSGAKEIQYILSIDADDPKHLEYLGIFKDEKIEIIVGKSKNVVQAMNTGAEHATCDEFMVCISDDFESIMDWDLELWQLMENELQAIQVKDGIINEKHSAYYRKHRKFEYIMTLPILTKKLYDKLGYVYYPEFTGMFADNDLAEECAYRGVLTLSDLLFKHNHFTVTKNSVDDTYFRHNNQQSWDIGEALIKKRRLKRK